MLTTNDEAIAERARVMRLHGMSKDAWRRFEGGPSNYDVSQPGFKYNMTDVAAAVGIVQLQRAEELREQREAVALYYSERLGNIGGIKPLQMLSERTHAWHLFVISVDPDVAGKDRDGIINHLRQRGIGASIHYQPLHRHTYYQNRYGFRDTDFPTASSAGDRIISLPLFPSMTLSQVDRVVRALEIATTQ